VKILRSYPLIATAILGLIFLGLYKTSNYVNTQVEVEKLSLLDSISTKPISSIENLSDSTIVSNTVIDSAQQVDFQAVKSTELIPPVNSVALPTQSNSNKEIEIVSAKSKVVTKTNEAKHKKRVNLEPSSSIDNSQSVHNGKQSETIGVKSVTKSKFHVIIGSYSIKDNAKATALEFEKKNSKKTSILKFKGFYRLSANNFDSEAEATQYASELKQTGINTLILKF
jgi:cell division protein FtsN